MATVSLVSAPSAFADTLEVGAGKTYATPCEAVAAAQPHDEIVVTPGTYTDSCELGVTGLVLRGEGGQPKIDLSGTEHPAQYKGIYVVTAADVTIENLELTGAHISDANGTNAAGIRVEAPNLTVRHCKIHDNQNGILGGTTGALTIEHTELAHNALGDGCNQGGCTHNVYVANIDALYFRFNWTHDLATDTPDKGHLLKSRAKASYIEYNRISGEDGFDSYELDLPNGGLAVIVGNVIEKGPHAGNSILLSWGEEGASNPDSRVFLVANTFVNDFGSGTFLSLGG
ncbi:MAG TPA: right-handed parallel beta-helix repeat-containing protein, partial [Polyangiales bacterium]|nr:right-handed parallel beta-helix repeat-containing protein [Polyangiales bacterium]